MLFHIKSYYINLMKNFKGIRKLKKLMRSPIKFFTDSFFLQLLLGKGRNESLGKAEEKAVNKIFGSFLFSNDESNFNLYKRTVSVDKKLTSLIIIDRGEGESYLIHSKKAKLFLEDKNFIGFKDRYSYFLYYDQNQYLPEDFQIFFENAAFRQNNFESFRNLFVFDPTNTFPFMLRMTSFESRLIVMLSEGSTSVEFVQKYMDYIDVLIFHESVELDPTLVYRRQIRYTTANSLEKIIKAVIIENSLKEKNMLFPVFGIHDKIENIDALNESDVDVVVVLNKHISATSTFDDFVSMMAENMGSMLIREESYYRYKTLVDSKNIKALLKFSLIDGAHYEII